ncbi:hypothetical protein ACFSSC_08955 [Corynebacterium mendelii]|nr:hypothetical protein [Corynebacterium mendelii]
MYDFVVTVTSFSVDGPLPNIFDFLAPFASLAGNVQKLIGLLPAM